MHLSDDDAKALVFVREAGAIDNATYRELNKIDPLAASGALRRLRDAGLLVQKGRGSATYYVPTERLTAQTERLSSNPEDLSSNLDVLSSNPTALSSQSQPEDEARRVLLATLPGELAARVGALGQRKPPEEVRVVVLDLCDLRQWRAEELATLLRRNVEYVRQNYLRPLLKDGSLRMTNEAEPNDPQQAYRTPD
ncbi:hypothetical protein [Noviherbaspirillum sp. Root189]|uniref:hypothetical protein n=1 Tax=Noviherbaspirillum sp. Root189 TaxID=1736487 RepID=UPI000ACD743F|nr:hypothetical protein [Noviherbaspirillum sp. Root189]